MTINRKLRKLVRNPNAFFSDSRFPLARRMSPYFGSRATTSKGNSVKTDTLKQVQDKLPPQAFVALMRIITDTKTSVSDAEIDNGNIRFQASNQLGSGAVEVKIDDLCLMGDTQVRQASPWEADSVVIFKSISGSSSSSIALNSQAWAYSGMLAPGLQYWREHFTPDDGDNLSKFYFARAEAARLGGIYDSTTIEDYELSIKISAEINANHLITWLNHVWNVEGTTADIKSVIKWAEKRANLNASHFMTIAGFFCDAGDYSNAVLAAKRAKRISSSAWSSNRTLGISHMLLREGLTKEQWAKRDSAAFEKFISNEGSFERMLARSARFAIVGNSPIQQGKGTGRKIDSSKLVIRFNTAPTDADFADDYGRRLDVLVRNLPNYDVKRQPRRDGIKLMLLSGSNKLYRNRALPFQAQEYLENYRVELVPDRFLRETIAVTERNPSSGLVLLTWLSKAVGNLQNQENVFGYGLTDQLSKSTAHYYESGNKVSRNTHDWDRERAWFDKIVAPVASLADAAE